MKFNGSIKELNSKDFKMLNNSKSNKSFVAVGELNSKVRSKI
jgi:hypothetical protein